MSMSDDAFKSMPPPPSILPKDEPKAPATASIQPRVVSPIDPKTGQPRRGRGRPPGSTNKPVTPSGGVNPPSRFSIPAPSRNQIPSTTDTAKDAEAKKQEKKAKAEQYATWINQELNDKLFMFLIGASNGSIKPEYIYKEGKVPLKAQSNPNLTELGNALAIPPDVADSWGKLLAEISYTDAGKNLSKITDNHMIAVIGAALAAAFSTYRYTQTLKPYLAMIKKVQESQKGPSEE